MDSKFFYLLFNRVNGLGPRRLNRLLEYFETADKVWYADRDQLSKVPDIPSAIIDEILTKRNQLNPVKELQRLKDQGIGVLFSDEPEYPPLLKEIFDPPKVLYYRGNPAVFGKRTFAIVGARKATHYGLSVSETIAAELAAADVCVVSGMARGIDSAAHKGALNVSGSTAAVLGCGVDVVYPKENRKLMDEIIKTGIVISEFPPGVSPIPGNFPQRNRIISGLSEGIMIIEAAEKSGSLITADFALEQGRDVFAVPGQVTNSLNRGAHRLIKQGARLVETAADVFEELAIEPSMLESNPKNSINGLTLIDKKIYNIVSDVPVNSEFIIETSGISASEVLSTLLCLELQGLIKQLPGHLYVRHAGNGMF